MQFFLIPVVIVVCLAIVAVVLLAVRRSLYSARVGLALLALLLSHGLVGVAVFVFKELDDNSYFAAATRTLLTETVTAMEQHEPNYLGRLKEFVATQRLSYETRGDLLENARAFAARGEILREEASRKVR